VLKIERPIERVALKHFRVMRTPVFGPETLKIKNPGPETDPMKTRAALVVSLVGNVQNVTAVLAVDGVGVVAI